MKIIITKNDLIMLEQFELMWEIEEEETALLESTSSMVGYEYGVAIAHKCYIWGGNSCTDYCLYETNSELYGEVYLLTVNHDDGEEVTTRRFLLPKWEGLTIEIE